MTKTLQAQLECARRELRLRQRIYPNRVMTGRMSRAQAEHETACMEAIVRTLEVDEQREQLL